MCILCTMLSFQPGKVREGYFCFPYMRVHTNIRILCFSFLFLQFFAVVASICETGMHVLHSPFWHAFTMISKDPCITTTTVKRLMSTFHGDNLHIFIFKQTVYTNLMDTRPVTTFESGMFCGSIYKTQPCKSVLLSVIGYSTIMIHQCQLTLDFQI